MDFKFARLQDAHVRFNGLEWNKLVCRVNKYHLKSISLLMFIGSFGFIVIQNIATENGAWNNYGVDCEFIQKAIMGEFGSSYTLTDIKIDGERKLERIDNGVTNAEEVVYKFTHRPVLNCLEYDDPHLTNSIREDLMIKPNYINHSYYLYDFKYTEMSSQPQALDVQQIIFKDKESGFFVEAGGFDCEQSSVTFPLEAKYGWTGIVIEPMPDAFEYCKGVNRKAYLINTCLGVEKHPYISSFDMNGGKVMVSNTSGFRTTPSFSSEYSSGQSIELQCYPLYSILLSLGNPTVHLFVLDIEGFELAVLQSIPWDKVDIQVLDVETHLAGIFQKDSSREKIIQFMEKQGYTRFDHKHDINTALQRSQNDLFVRADIVQKYNVQQL